MEEARDRSGMPIYPRENLSTHVDTDDSGAACAIPPERAP